MPTFARSAPPIDVAVTVSCKDIACTALFYQEVLGASPIPGQQEACRWYRLGAMRLALTPNALAASPADLVRQHATFMLWLEVVDLAHARAAAERFGGAVLVDDGTYMLVRDPNGLLIELWPSTSA